MKLRQLLELQYRTLNIEFQNKIKCDLLIRCCFPRFLLYFMISFLVCFKIAICQESTLGVLEYNNGWEKLNINLATYFMLFVPSLFPVRYHSHFMLFVFVISYLSIWSINITLHKTFKSFNTVLFLALVIARPRLISCPAWFSVHSSFFSKSLATSCRPSRIRVRSAGRIWNVVVWFKISFSSASLRLNHDLYLVYHSMAASIRVKPPIKLNFIEKNL